jgi:uncharacterized protein (TIGR02996 family)
VGEALDEDAIRAAPEDDEPRLAWARAAGGPRGDLVRVQCALARGEDAPGLRAREAELLGAHGAGWAAPTVFALGAHRWRFVRGFVEHAEVTAARLVRRAPALRASLVRSLRVTEIAGRLDALLGMVGLDELAALDLSENALTNQDVARIADAPLGRLRALDLGRNDIDDRGVERLAVASGPRRVEVLGLASNLVEEGGAQALAASPLPLVELDLAQRPFGGHQAGNVIGPAALARLALRPWRRLVLSGNPVDSAGAELLAARARGLEVLEAADAHIGPSGAWALAASAHLGGLRLLDLSANPLGDAGASALAASPFLPASLELRVLACGLAPAAVARLAARFARVES